MTRTRSLTFANVTSALALAVALGGTSYAATQLPKNSVGTAQIQNGAVSTPKLHDNAVTGSKIKNGSVGVADIAAQALPPGTISIENEYPFVSFKQIEILTLRNLQFTVQCQALSGSPADATLKITSTKGEPLTINAVRLISGQSQVIAGQSDDVLQVYNFAGQPSSGFIGRVRSGFGPWVSLNIGIAIREAAKPCLFLVAATPEN